MTNEKTTSTDTGNGDEGYKGLDSDKKKRREPLAVQGVDNLSDAELLEILVSPGCNGKKAAEIAADLLHTFSKSLKEVFTATIHQLTQVEGIGFVEACKIKAGFELWKRTIAYCDEVPEIKSPIDVIRLLAPHMMFSKQEEFRVLLLDSKRRLIRHCRVSLGSLDAALVEPRDVFRPAITEDAASIVIAHNHPSGNPEPSEQDILLTRELSLCGMMLSIDVLDHIIIGFQDHVSFKDKGLMQ